MRLAKVSTLGMDGSVELALWQAREKELQVPATQKPAEAPKWKEGSQSWRGISGGVSAGVCLETRENTEGAKDHRVNTNLKRVRCEVSELCHELMCPDGPEGLS